MYFLFAVSSGKGRKSTIKKDQNYNYFEINSEKVVPIEKKRLHIYL